MLLRRPLTLAMLALMAIALSASIALVALTTGLHRNTHHLAGAMELVATADEALIDLRTLDALVAQPAGARDDKRRLAISHRVDALAARLRSLEAGALEAGDRPAAQEVERVVSAYLAFARPEQREPAGPHGVGRAEVFEAARLSLRRFAELEGARARASVAAAGRLDRAANVWGLGAAALALFGTATVLWLMQRRLFRPLQAIGRSIAQYADGTRGLRAPEIGAAEPRLVARRFNELATRLERTKDDQLAFLAGLAHDLRNPLSAMRLAARSLPLDGERPDRARAKLAVIERQIDRLERLASDFLDAARAEAGQLRVSLGEHDVRDLARAVAELYGTSSSHPIQLVDRGEPLLARCDPTRIEQVVTNLVTNAIKYSPDGVPVRIAVQRRDAEVVVEVKDEGIGIDRDELEQIFEPFRRGKSVAQGIPGLGIGLATSRRIAELHGGRLTVASTPGGGSTFALALPLASPHALATR